LHCLPAPGPWSIEIASLTWPGNPLPTEPEARQAFIAFPQNIALVQVPYLRFQHISHSMLLFLLGFMGSGKTYSATLLSKQWNLPHIDLDHWIEEQEGMTISTIFEQKGEEYFRKAETEALHKILLEYGKSAPNLQGNSTLSDHIINKFNIFAVISVGGGTPCFHGNMDLMNSNGLTIWLDPPEEVIVERLMREAAKRPLIAERTGSELRSFVHQKRAEREQFYAKARFRVESHQELLAHVSKEP
jgi:shikimate kinase